ncbi:MAG: hypothetical protein ACRDY6_19300 [Acidimicrobiia bacterium]
MVIPTRSGGAEVLEPQRLDRGDVAERRKSFLGPLDQVFGVRHLLVRPDASGQDPGRVMLLRGGGGYQR